MLEFRFERLQGKTEERQERVRQKIPDPYLQKISLSEDVAGSKLV